MIKFEVRVEDGNNKTDNHAECVKFLLSAMNCCDIMKEWHDDDRHCTIFEIEVKTNQHADVIRDLSRMGYFYAVEQGQQIGE